MTAFNKYTCKRCPSEYKFPCKQEFGAERDDGDDYRAIEGSHFCRFTWSDFRCCHKKEGS